MTTMASGLRRRQVLAGWLAGGCGLAGPGAVWARGAATHAAPALPLAREMPADLDPQGYLVSEKLDGVRAFWDGQRLCSRAGLVLAAPDWFLRRLPPQPLDGELWLGRGRFEALVGTVRRQQPDDDAWRAVSYQVFELPGAPGPFRERAAALAQLARAADWPGLQAVPQTPVADAQALRQRLDAVVAGGGEGLMLHHAEAAWVTGRTDRLLKLKPQQDADAVVLTHVPGRGRLAGQMGALRVRNEDGQVLQVGSGFSDALRQRPPAVGSLITYRWRGLTADGVPRFATFVRVRDAAL